MLWVCPECGRGTTRPWLAPGTTHWTCATCAPCVAGGSCGKRRFASRAAAETELVRTQAKAARGMAHRLETRTYWCSWCSAWHLTSQQLVQRT